MPVDLGMIGLFKVLHLPCVIKGKVSFGTKMGGSELL